MQNDDCPLKTERDYVLHDVGDELLVLDEKHEQLHQLNATAAYLWDLCDGQHSVQAMAKELSDFYGIDEAVALKDVRHVLDDLARLNLIHSAKNV